MDQVVEVRVQLGRERYCGESPTWTSLPRTPHWLSRSRLRSLWLRLPDSRILMK